MQAWKIVIPTSNATPEPRAHDGHEWIYVLSGRMRLVLGDQDWVLGPGEIAAFDTTVTDWFGSIGSFAARTWFASDGESNVQDATSLTVWRGAKVEHTSDLNRPQRA